MGPIVEDQNLIKALIDVMLDETLKLDMLVPSPFLFFFFDFTEGLCSATAVSTRFCTPGLAIRGCSFISFAFAHLCRD